MPDDQRFMAAVARKDETVSNARYKSIDTFRLLAIRQHCVPQLRGPARRNPVWPRRTVSASIGKSSSSEPLRRPYLIRQHASFRHGRVKTDYRVIAREQAYVGFIVEHLETEMIQYDAESSRQVRHRVQ